MADDPAEVAVVIVDDHEMFASGLSRLLADEPGIEVLGWAPTVADGLALVDRSHPDVALVDFLLPDGDGVTLTGQIKASHPHTQVVMLTGAAEERVMLGAIEAGCSGFLTKDRAAGEVVDAVRTVTQGEALISPTMLKHLLPKLTRTGHTLGDDLTQREREVLELVAAGLANRAIAAELFLSVNTVRNYVASILSKLNCHSKLEAVSTAVRAGVIDYP